MKLRLGTSVRCSDGNAGELTDIVIDPAKKRVTHLVVDRHDDEGNVRLIPVELADRYDAEAISLDCTQQQLDRFESVRESAFLGVGEMPKPDPEWDVGAEDVYSMPSPGVDELGSFGGDLESNVGITYDRVPKGEVELRRSSAIESADGDYLGHLQGIVIDDNRITSVTIERGHLWWKKDVAIPVDSVSKVETDTVTVRLSSDEVKALPSTRAGR